LKVCVLQMASGRDVGAAIGVSLCVRLAGSIAKRDDVLRRTSMSVRYLRLPTRDEPIANTE
jgi:hypothetical protein